MTLKQRLIALNHEHPEYTVKQAAMTLRCPRGSVSGYTSELGLSWASSRGCIDRPAIARQQRLDRIRSNIALAPSRSMFVWPDESRAA